MARRWRRAPRLRRALTLAILAAAIVVAAATVSSRTESHPSVAALPADPDAPARLMAPADLAEPTVGPPLYPAHNTDGEAGSGPVAVAYHDGGRTITDAAITARAPAPRLFNTGYGGWEPTIGITKDGTIFFDARNSNADPGVVRSRDSGLTWQNINPSPHKVSLDPYLWVDTSTGRIFDSDIDPTVTCPPLSYSDDQGASWKTSLACGQTDHQSQFGGPPPAGGAKASGYPNVVYFCAISGGEGAGSSTITGCSRSLDGGASFSLAGDPAYGTKVTGNPQQPNCDGGAGHGIVDADGTVYLPRIWCGPPYVAISHDEGATWAQIKVADKPQLGFSDADGAFPHESGIAADRAGNLYYAWVADDRHPYLAISRDHGQTWSAPRDIMPPGVGRMSAFTASIDAGDPGKLAVVFMGTADRGDPTDKTRWNAYVITSADALSADPVFYGATMNDPATNALWIGADCSDVRCGDVGDFLDVVIGPDGTAWSALVDSCPGADQCTNFGVTDPRGEAVAGHLVGGPPLIGTVAEQLPHVALPSASRSACRSRRRFRIRLREPRRGRIASARVYVNGKRVRTLSGKRLRAPVDLRGLPKGTYTVRVVARTTTGRTLTRTRRYRTCVPRQKGAAR